MTGRPCGLTDERRKSFREILPCACAVQQCQHFHNIAEGHYPCTMDEAGSLRRMIFPVVLEHIFDGGVELIDHLEAEILTVGLAHHFAHDTVGRGIHHYPLNGGIAYDTGRIGVLMDHALKRRLGVKVEPRCKFGGKSAIAESSWQTTDGRKQFVNQRLWQRSCVVDEDELAAQFGFIFADDPRDKDLEILVRQL